MTARKSFISRYIGDKAFYAAALTIALPMILQDLITNFVSLLDNVMVGALGTEEVAGVAIANQIVMIFNLAIFGAMSGAGIFTAQYYGKGDDEGIRYTVRYKLILAFIIFAVGAAVLLLFDSRLITLFLHVSEEGGDPELTLSYARTYIRVMLFGLLPFGLAQVFSGTLRETGNTVTPMITGAAAVATNCIFNYLLIFGKLFFPALGVKGAAIATVLSRWVELSLVAAYFIITRKRHPYIMGLFRSFRVPRELLVGFTKKAMPLLGNETLWSMGMAALSVAFSLNGLHVVAAYSISSTVSFFFSILFFSTGVSIGIISGRHLGAGEHEEAVDAVRKLIVLSLGLSLVMLALLFVCAPLITLLYKEVDQASKTLAVYFMRVFALTMPIKSLANSSYFVLRSGGKTLMTFFFDCGMLWAVSVTLAFGLFYIFGLDIHAIFAIVEGAELLKALVGYILIKRRKWVKTIV